MREPRILPLAALITIAMLGVTAARADDVDAGAYFGGNFGRAHNTFDTAFIDSELAAAATVDGDTAAYRAKSTRRMSDVWWADGGYLFNPYVGIEAAFFHLGEIKYWAVGTLITPAGEDALSTKSEISSKGPALSLVLRLPLTNAFEADLRVGDLLWENNVQYARLRQLFWYAQFDDEEQLESPRGRRGRLYGGGTLVFARRSLAREQGRRQFIGRHVQRQPSDPRSELHVLVR